MVKIKTFKDIKTFEEKVKESICWEDYFKIGNKLYSIYEYGGGSLFKMDYDFVYFLNRRTKTLIYIKYICPSYRWENSIKKQIKEYKFISFEVIENAYLWR